MFKLCELTRISTYQYVGFFTIPCFRDAVKGELVPTGRWKIRIVDEGEPMLLLECRRVSRVGPALWFHEGRLKIEEWPDPPVIKEYINECARCE